MRKRTRFLLACTAALLPLQTVRAQVEPQEPAGPCTVARRLQPDGLRRGLADFARVVEVAGYAAIEPRMIRRSSDDGRLALCGQENEGFWHARLRDAPATAGLVLELLPLSSSSHVNTAYPRDRNDGALWAGRGLSTELRGGVAARWGPISAALAPGLVYQRNNDFDMLSMPRGGRSPYAHPWHRNIDLPQRFGVEDFWTAHPGQSYLRLDAYGAAIGLSTENLWWGPALQNPILLSNTGPGFPHLFIGTSTPVDIRIGRLEAQAFWGRLTESDYFDDDPDNDRRLFAGLTFDLELRWIPGLFLGMGRTYMGKLPPDGLDIDDFLLRPYRDPFTNPLGRDNPLADNEILAVFARWVHPESGFETYLEWAREDHWADLIELLKRPESSRGYTVGFQKVFAGAARWFRLYGEYTQLEDAPPVLRAARSPVVFYTHSGIVQGYTHRGQLLGAAIGPGSNAQVLGLDRFDDRGRIGIFVERVRYDADAYNQVWARHYTPHGHDLELTAGVHQLLFLRDFEIAWGLGYSRRENRSFIGLDGLNWDFLIEGNWSLDLRVTWSPELTLFPAGPSTAAAPR